MMLMACMYRLLRLCFSRSAKSGETDRESADRGTTDRAGATNSGGRFVSIGARHDH